MLILYRLVFLHLILGSVFCDNVETTEKTPTRPFKAEYTSGGVGSYSRGGLYSHTAITHSHESGSGEGCNMDELVCLSMVSQDRLGLEAIRQLHGQLDDDADGNVDLSESDEFLREDLKYEDGYQRRQQAFHRNDDNHISVRELWDAWVRSEVHNWTVEQTTDWLAASVELPQYIPTFKQHLVTGATLPRLAVSNSPYLNVVLGIKDPIHKQKISLKAMDVVLFGPPKDLHHHTKDMLLVTLVLVVLFGFYYGYQQKKSSNTNMLRMMKDMELLHAAEQTLVDLQHELEVAKKEQECFANEKMNLEKRLLEQAGDGDGMRIVYSDLEVAQLKQEVEMLRDELQRAEGELKDRCWSPPVGLQNWLQLTHEIENKSYLKKRQVAEKQLTQAREACEKLRKKRSSLVGAFVSTHGKCIDDVDRSIVEARTSLNEVTAELQERAYRWKQIEQLCGFNISNNAGVQYLEAVLYRNAPNGRGLRGRMSSQDDLDEDSASVYAPSAGGLEGWKEDSSGSEQGRNELDDDLQTDTRSVSSNVHFTIGGDSWADDIPPIPVVPKRMHKTSMVRSFSQDTNVNTDRDRDFSDRLSRDLSSNQSKLSQSETNLEPAAVGGFRVPSTKPEVEEARAVRRMVGEADEAPRISRRVPPDLDVRRTIAETEEVMRPVRRAEVKATTKELSEVDEVTAFRRAVRDWEVPDSDERAANFRKARETSDEFRRLGRDSSLEEIRRGRLARDSSTEENVRRLAKLKEEIQRRGDGGHAQDDDAQSTDSNSACTDDSEYRRRKRKIFGHFRKDRSKPS